MPVIVRVGSNGTIDVEVSILVKGRVRDAVEQVVDGAVCPAPVMRPLPLALGGGSEESEKSGEEGDEKFGKIQRAKS